jgi:hypothetical protein
MPVTQLATSLTQSQDFGMGGRILIPFAAVGGFDQGIVAGANHNGSNRHISSDACGLSQFQGTQHPATVA